MSHFYGYLEGGRGTVTRTGHPKTGINSRLQNHSVKVDTRLYQVDGEDRYVVEVKRDSGSEIVASGTL